MGRGLKGTRMEVPPPFAILQASRGAKRRSTAWQEEPGGGWRSAGIWGEFLESESGGRGPNSSTSRLRFESYLHLGDVRDTWPEAKDFAFLAKCQEFQS